MRNVILVTDEVFASLASKLDPEGIVSGSRLKHLVDIGRRQYCICGGLGTGAGGWQYFDAYEAVPIFLYRRPKTPLPYPEHFEEVRQNKRPRSYDGLLLKHNGEPFVLVGPEKRIKPISLQFKTSNIMFVNVQKLQTVKNFSEKRNWSTTYVYNLFDDANMREAAQNIRKEFQLLEIDTVKFVVEKEHILSNRQVQLGTSNTDGKALESPTKQGIEIKTPKPLRAASKKAPVKKEAAPAKKRGRPHKLTGKQIIAQAKGKRAKEAGKKRGRPPGAKNKAKY